MAGPSSSPPKPTTWIVLLAIFMAAPVPRGLSAQEIEGAAPDLQSEAAFLFAYRAKPGQRGAFDEGYRRHLEWHAEHDDPFVWYGWDVVTGSDVGVFVDGTFGPTPAEFDGRVAPAEDAADFAATAGPFADPLWRRIYRVRPDLGTSSFLEDREPTPFLRVLEYALKPGSGPEFEELLNRAARRAEAPEAGEGPRSWAAYELLDGGRAPGFLLLIPATGTAAVGAGGPMAWLEALVGPDDRSRVRDNLFSAVDGASSALWVLRRDLTLVPGESP